MSVLCLLLVGYCCFGEGRAFCGAEKGCMQAASVGSGAAESGCVSVRMVYPCCRKSGCTGFGSASGVCGDAAYYARQYALCRCCCGC